MIIRYSDIEKLSTNSLVKNIMEREYSRRTSVWLARFMARIGEEAKIYMAERQKLIEKHAARTSTGDIVREGTDIRIADFESFSSEFGELQSIEIELAGIDPVEFDIEKEPQMTPAELMLLMPYMTIKE